MAPLPKLKSGPRKTHPKKLPKTAKLGKNKKKNFFRTNQAIFQLDYIKNPVPNPMLLLPALKIGVMKKYAQKNGPRWAKPGKRHIQINKPISQVFLMQNFALNPMVSLTEIKKGQKWAKNMKMQKKGKSIG